MIMAFIYCNGDGDEYLRNDDDNDNNDGGNE